MELERFLDEISAEFPAGSDLAESGDLLELDQLSAWSDPDKPSQWPALRDAATAALERSRDLRATVYLAGALLQTEGIQSFCASLGLMRSLLENLWDDVYPRLDGDDAIERSSAVFNLVNFDKIIQPLRLAPLVDDRGTGCFSLQDVEIAQGKRKAASEREEEHPPEALIIEAFETMDLDELRQLDAAVTQGSADLGAMEAIFTERLGAGAGPNLARVREPLNAIRALTGARLGARSVDSSVKSEAETEAGAVAPRGVIAADGAARSRQEAIRALDGVLRYFRSHEPSSPVPLLLERAKRLIDRNFMEILEDIAPDALAQAKAISGRGAEES
ncbi:MAG: type VI secretion system protein TssA [Nitrococcus sp.]|nr:type VI secretion system protein TssA [Nitrococcus sp.]